MCGLLEFYMQYILIISDNVTYQTLNRHRRYFALQFLIFFIRKIILPISVTTFGMVCYWCLQILLLNCTNIKWGLLEG